MGHHRGTQTIGPFRRAARRTAALLALLAAGATCAALPSFVSGAGTDEGANRMTGTAARLLAPTVAVTYGFDVRCNAAGRRQKLELSWGRGERFRLTRLNSVTCIDDLNIGHGQPRAGFDTLMGRGVGRYNGRPGATIRFRFVDLGAGGAADAVDVRVRKPSGADALVLDGRPDHGDHRAR